MQAAGGLPAMINNGRNLAWVGSGGVTGMPHILSVEGYDHDCVQSVPLSPPGTQASPPCRPAGNAWP